MASEIGLLILVGARPNFMKAAPLIRELGSRPGVRTTLVHTGQHYDREMSEVFFADLDLPAPDVHLAVGSGSNSIQIARTMIEVQPLLLRFAPDILVVLGDTNATVAGGLVATELGVPIGHVEAGLRSFDRTMPEEVNRVVVDRLANYLFTTERDANANLRREGIPDDQIFFVGNIMVDTLMDNVEAARARASYRELGLEPRSYALLTLHRPSNVDTKEALDRILYGVREAQARMPVVFPVHPRTKRRLQEHGLIDQLQNMRGLQLLKPSGYLEFLSLLDQAMLVLTDSGGIQEETTCLGVPCLTLRDNTERPVTVQVGTNALVGTDPDTIGRAVRQVMDGRWKRGRLPELWDGRTAQRIAKILVEAARGSPQPQMRAQSVPRSG